MPDISPTVHLRRELKDATEQVRKLGAMIRAKKQDDAAAAETAALWHLIEAQRWIEKVGQC